MIVKIKKIKKFMKIVLPVIILILLDQVIKIYIATYFTNKNFYFIDNILGFKPSINSKYSWFSSVSNIGINLRTHIVFVSMIFLASVIIFDFIRNKYTIGKFENWIFIFLFAGELCSLIDKIFWGGSLDYIWLKNFFIFDLKDVYITIFEIVVILCVIFNYKGLLNLKLKDFCHAFKDYIKVKYLKR